MIYQRLLETARKTPDNIAVSCSQKQITFRRLLEMTDRVSAGLAKLGVEKSDEILVCLPNSVEYVLCFYALAKLKAKIVPVNFNSKTNEIRLYTRQRLPKIAIVHESAVERFGVLPSGEVKIIVPQSSKEPFDNLEKASFPAKEKRESFGGDFVVLFSSGSTGRPKKMCRSQESYIHEMEGFIETTGLSSDDGLLAAIPLYHSHGIGSCLLPALGSGCRLTLLADSVGKAESAPTLFAHRLSEIADLIQSEKTTVLPLIPYMFQTMIDSEIFTRESSRSVRLCFSSGNFLPEEIYRKFLEKFELPILQIYGCSEAGAVAINGKPENKFPWNSCGVPLPHFDLVIKKEDGSPGVPGEVGEALFKSPSLISGYTGQPELNKQTFQDGYFSAGDLGTLDENGALILTGRKKLLIDTGGNKVDPFEVEDLLARHPKVKEAVVLGVETASGGEIVKAVMTTSSPCSTEEITRFCRENTAPFKVPKIIEFRDEIPKTPTGKILRKDLVFSESFLDKVETLFIRILHAGLELDASSFEDGPFSDSELDSVTVMELNSYMADYFPNLPKTLLFERQTPKALTDYFKERHPEMFLNYLKDKGISYQETSEPGKKKESLYSEQPYQNSEDIAVIGMSCLFPGSPDKESFWRNLVEEKDLITEVPKTRWDWRDYYDDSSGNDDGSYIKWGGFVNDIDAFDARFFYISNQEAELMDPQQRMLLQNSWAAIEDAGYDPQSFRGKSAGVFVGVMTGDYEELVRSLEAAPHLSSGISRAVCANRVSYFLGLEGPSVAVDAACASSLAAVHQAISAIRNGECSLALAAGVNALITPALTISLGKLGMLSKDGRCKAFDQSANGYVRSEGCGVILLKPLSRAVRDKDHIYGIVKGSAMNHGGKVRSITVPNPNAQAKVVVEAHQRAGISPDSVGYIECQGIGAPLADPIEISGLKKAFAELYRARGLKPPTKTGCALGSIKSNVGHLESAAGIAGIIKTLLAFQYKKLPANLHFQKLNHDIDLSDSPFYIASKPQNWRRLKDETGKSTPLRAGVSSFGFGGANAHVVLEERRAEDSAPDELVRPCLTTLSAQNKERLKEYAQKLIAFLKDADETVSLANLAYTTQVGRTPMEERLAAPAENKAELLSKLGRYVKTGRETDGLYLGNVKSKKNETGLLASGKSGELFIKAAIEEQEFDKLARLWVGGARIDWGMLHGEREFSRIPLPAYPFDRKRHWVEESEGSDAAPGKAVLKTPHPLLDANVSTLTEQAFVKELREDQFYLKDHRINREKTLPSAVYMEMARAAGELAGGRKIARLKNIVCAGPLKVGDEPTKVKIVLYPENRKLLWLIADEASKETVYSQGELEYVAKDSDKGLALDIESIKKRISKSKTKAEYYQILEKTGLKHGRSFQVVESLRHNENEVLAKLKLPDFLSYGFERFVLHPVLLEGALRSVAELAMSEEKTTFSSFALKELEITRPLEKEVYAYAVLNSDSAPEVKSFDVKLLNPAGEVLASLSKLAPQVFQSSEEEKPESFFEESDKARELTETELGAKLLDDLIAMASAILKVEKSEIDPSDNISQLGFDSIGFTALTNKLNEKFDLELRPPDMFEHTEIDSLKDYLLNEHKTACLSFYKPTLTESVPEEIKAKTIPAARPALKSRFASFNTAGSEIRPATGEDIAIVGMACRFPGASSLSEFWRNLEDGYNCIVEVPEDRWDWRRYGDEKSFCSRWGGFLTDIDKFDAGFFNISPREAKLMDPQQRIFLEVVWEVLEDAGKRVSDLKGSETGLFVGVSGGSYNELLRRAGAACEAHAPSGIASSVLANRVSYTFDWRGPSEAVDTACSSSLVAMHRAVQAIQSGDCDMAVAGGVSLMLTPDFHVAFSRSGMLSEDGRCKTFDGRADGYVRGEGAGALLLKPLSAALRNNDRIYGTIKSSAVNHGGQVSALTVPNPNAQAALVVKAHKKAGISPDSVGYIECHGTGTSLGDPIEVNGLKKAFAELYQERGLEPPTEARCALGSVKTNIGHLESAAGIAGVIKTLLAFQYKKLPANLNFEKQNPYIDLTNTPFYIASESRDWEPLKSASGAPFPLRAGVSSFGFGGANAHIVLEERLAEDPAPGKFDPPYLIPLSAKNTERLNEYARKIVVFLEDAGQTVSLAELSHTLQAGREPMNNRLAMLVDNKKELLSKLKEYLKTSQEASGLYLGNVKKEKSSGELLIEGREGREFFNIIIEEKNLGKLARLWANGIEIDWNLLYGETRPRVVSLPAYPFARERYWIEQSSQVESGSENRSGKTILKALPRPLAKHNVPRLKLRDRESLGQKTVLKEAASNLATDDIAMTLKQELSEALLIDVSEIDEDETFKNLGLDSVLGVEFLNKINRTFDTDLSATKIYDYPSIKIFSQYLAGVVKPKSKNPELGEKPSPDSTKKDIEASLKKIPLKARAQKNSGVGKALDSAGSRNKTTQVAGGFEKNNIAMTLKQELSEALLIDVSEIDEDETFKNLGLDSVLGVEFLNKINRTFDIDLPATKIYDYPSIKVFSQYLAGVVKPKSKNPELREKPTLGSLNKEKREIGLSLKRIALKARAQNKEETGRAAEIETLPGRKVPDSGDATIKPEKDDVAMTLKQELSETLLIDVSEIDEDETFKNLGLDSVLGVEFLNKINRTFDIDLPATKIYDYPSIKIFSQYLAGVVKPKSKNTKSSEEVALSSSNEEKKRILLKTRAQNKPETESATESRAFPSRKVSISGAGMLRAEETTIKEDIAVIGLSSCFPDADDQYEFWRNLAAGKDSIREIPSERWDWRRYYDPDPQAPGKTNSKWGAFLDDIDKFDPLFFKISPTEAELMDPQQRLFLQEAWKALEDAGYSTSSLNDVKCGVYVGVGDGDYQSNLQKKQTSNPAYALTGNSNSILAARISYFLNLKGAALAVDTACSSSLVAIHLACQSLIKGEAEMMLAGGVSLYSSSDLYVMTGKAGMLAADGRCKTFDDSADGFVPGEGVGVLLLKPLGKAIADHDNIYGVIKGSKINQDGKTNGITAPGVISQKQLELEVYQSSGINPETISYVEAHGTGTKLGDPIEIEALKESFGEHTDKKQYCAIGSVKTNIGHTLAAAGTASTIKTLLAMKHGKIPPSLHFKNCNQHIDFINSPFYVNTDLRDWPAENGLPRRAAVSSFGFSGTNAHVVLEERPREAIVADEFAPPYVVVISARNKERLKEYAEKLVRFMEENGEEIRIADLAYTLQVGRNSMKERLALAVGGKTELSSKLGEYLETGAEISGLYLGSAKGKKDSIPGESDKLVKAAMEDKDFDGLARLWVGGVEIDWTLLYGDARPRRVSLPAYPFAKERHWITKKDEGSSFQTNIETDIAVIGVSGRFPGAENLDEFWKNLARGENSVREVPPERWDMGQLYDPDPNAPDKSYCKHGGFLKRVDRFDPLFFKISPREAEQMDPCQRIFLEEAWKAFEDAGYAGEKISGEKCGVFVGASAGDYYKLLDEAGEPKEAAVFTGSSASILASRISYFLNLKGPALAIDTACSSSLVAVNQACQSLVSGESELALAGGVFLSSPDFYVLSSKARMLSPEGKCKTFDDSADGFAPGEGAGAVLLKPLSRAIKDRDNIYGVIKGWGTNQDGMSKGLTAPSAAAQSDLENYVYERFNINPETIGYIEADGSGTKLGDTTELEGLTRAFDKYGVKKRSCALGSVKTNIGHLAAAAGIAGFVKALLCLKHQRLVPSLNCKTPNSRIDFEDSPFYVGAELKEWPEKSNHPRRAAISSFGFSGTNAHVVLEERRDNGGEYQTEFTPWPVVLSAKNEAGLKARAEDLILFMENGAEKISLADAAYTLQVCRESMKRRLALTAEDKQDLLSKLKAYLKNGRDTDGLYTGNIKTDSSKRKLLTGKEPEEFCVKNAIQNKQTDKLLQLWVVGAEVDWSLLYGKAKPRKISLPAYPFAKKRCWFNDGAE